MVVPTGPDTTTVVYDYFLEKDKMEELGGDLESYVEESLAESDKVVEAIGINRVQGSRCDTNSGGFQ